MGRPDLLQPRDAPSEATEAPADQAGPQDAAELDDPQAGSRIAAARGLIIGLALSAVLWAGILALLLRG